MENDELQTETVVETTETDVELDLPDYDTLAQQKAELEKKVKTLDAQRLHFKEKAEKAGTGNLTKESPTAPDIEKKLERLELKTEGYSDSEVDFITQYGGKKALENPIVKAAIEKIRQDEKLAKATDIKSGGAGSKEKTYSDEELRNMPLDELEKKIQSGKIKS